MWGPRLECTPTIWGPTTNLRTCTQVLRIIFVFCANYDVLQHFIEKEKSPRTDGFNRHVCTYYAHFYLSRDLSRDWKVCINEGRSPYRDSDDPGFRVLESLLYLCSPDALKMLMYIQKRSASKRQRTQIISDAIFHNQHWQHGTFFPFFCNLPSIWGLLFRISRLMLGCCVFFSNIK